MLKGSRRIVRFLSGIAVGAVAALPLIAYADNHIQEIVVSVRKVEENVQDIPVQVTVFGQLEIERERMRQLDDVARLTPSVQFDTGFWPSDTRVSIRGLFNRAGRPSAAVLIDGIDAMSESIESAGGSALLNQRILDLERIEVARGPQSALYGRAAFGGAINYVTRRPPNEFEIGVTADVAQYGRNEVQGMVGGPIIKDVLTFNAMASSYNLDGYYENPNTGDDLGGGNSTGGAFALNYTPTDSLSIYWNNTYSDDEFDPQAVAAVKADSLRILLDDGTLIPSGDLADCPPPRGGDPGENGCLRVVTGTIHAEESDINISPDPRTYIAGNTTTARDYAGTDDETYRSSLIIDWDMNEAFAFRSASMYTDSDQSVKLDTTQQWTDPSQPIPNTTGNYSDAIYTFNFKQYYQDFQLIYDNDGTFNWLVGVNGFWENAESRNRSAFWYRNEVVCIFQVGELCPGFEDAARVDKTIERDTTSYSLYGLFGVDITDAIKLTLEGRYIYDDINIYASTSDSVQASLFPPYTYPGTPGFRDSTDDKNFLPRASIDWFLNEEVMVYASVAKGIKPPTYNTTDIVDPDTSAVEKETLWTYEIGTKTTWQEGRLIVNSAIFYNDYKDQQVLVQFPSLQPGGNPRSGTSNAGKVEVWGLELDTAWQATDNLYLGLSYTYTNGEYDSFILADAQPDEVPVSTSNQVKAGSRDGDFSGNDTVGNPDHAAVLTARWQQPISGDLEWFADATVSYQGKRYADIANLVELDSYERTDLQLGLQDEKWSAWIYVENLFDDDTVTYAQEFIDQEQGFSPSLLTFPVAYYAYLPEPRVFGAKFTYKTN